MAKSTTSRMIGWAIRLLVGAMIFSVVGVLLWRIVSSGDPASMTTLQPNDKICAAYQQEGEQLQILHQQHDTIIREGPSKGYFSVTQSEFIPAANQLQITFRYNNSTLKYVAEDYGKEKPLERGKDWFDVTVTVAYDLTPSNTADNALNDPESVRFERFQPTACVKDTKNLYNYERLTFDGVDICDGFDEQGNPIMKADVLAVYVDIYFNEDIDYDAEPLGTLLIYLYGNERKVLCNTPDQKDIAALEAYAQK
ncbi:MAG: hypothetical protein IJW70_12060 [Clostridia bacterium]|nr:hypothetical protein [Clostridia bacterium]MBQ7380399.1 hypothetical protein [Clostridia bacterium]